MMAEARLLAIAVRAANGAPMTLLDRVDVSIEKGLTGDKHSHPGRRQVTLMSQQVWQRVCEELGQTLPWTVRRANLLVDSLPLHQSKGARIYIDDVVLQVTGETDPCAKMEKAQPGLYQALVANWRGGVTCRVLQGGILQRDSRLSMELAE